MEHQPLGRFEWEQLLRDIRLPPGAKYTGAILATYANADGSRAHPGEDLLADVLGWKQRAVRSHLALLRRLGLIHRISHGGSKRRLADVYQLTMPDDLPGRLAREGIKLRHDTAGVSLVENPDPPEEPRHDSAGDAEGSDTEPRHTHAKTPAAVCQNSGTHMPPTTPCTTPGTTPMNKASDDHGAEEEVTPTPRQDSNPFADWTPTYTEATTVLQRLPDLGGQLIQQARDSLGDGTPYAELVVHAAQLATTDDAA